MFADIGFGILSTILVSLIFKIQPGFWMFSAGAFFPLAPDFDFLYYYPRRGDTKNDYRHRDLIHYPLIYLPIGSIIFWIIFGKIWALLFLIASFCHFLHDSIGIGWGIKWFFPFSKTNFAFFYLYSKENKKGLCKPILSFNEEELKEAVKIHGDSNWVENIYHKWHWIAIIELVIFIISLAILAVFLILR